MTIRDDFINMPKMADLARYCVTDFVKSVAARLPSDTLLLDAGAGECAYKELFKHCNYKSVDLAIGENAWHYEHLDYVAPLDNLPIENDSFDAVLCTQVLEHLQKPAESVKEMHRVLKKGGYLFLTAPMAQNEHQTPYDYFRYTSFGLKYLCEAAGFKEVDVQPMGGMFYRWAYELPRTYMLIPKTGINRLIFFPFRVFYYFFIRLFKIVFVALDRFDKKSNDPWGWKVIARK